MNSRSNIAIPLVARLALVAAALVAGAASTSANSVSGAWSPVYSWPCVSIHLHLLPDGRVLSYADDDNPNYLVNGARLAGYTRTFMVDVPNGGAPTNVVEIPNNRTNMFCSGHSFLGDGRLFVIGGHLGEDGWGEPRTEFFDFRDPTAWLVGQDMFQGRWYPSAVVMGNGDLVAISGTMDSTHAWASIPEVWRAEGVGGFWRQLTNANRVLPYYPFSFLAPNGKVFCAGPNIDSRYLDTNGLGSWSFVANHILNRTRSYGSAVQYGDGRILVVGGDDPPTSTCETINLNQQNPSWQSSGSMANARRQLNTTILPDGTVLATGGSSATGFNNAAGAVLAAELWNPTAGMNGEWTTMASMAKSRMYHSSTVLLPDGRVLSVGGGRPKAVNGGADQYNAEIYSPPYLFKGARPEITSAPAVVNNGVAFTIQTPSSASVARVTMVKLSSTTHAFNMGQRFNTLTFSAGGGAIQATVPSSTALAPPGYYMLFLLNGTGVPSIAKMIRVLPPGPVDVEETPGGELLDFIALRSANPSHGEARIAFTLSRSEAGKVEVLDVTGRRVKLVADGFFDAGRERVVTWDGTDDHGARVSSGIYWYRLQTATVTRTGKLALLSH